MTMPTNLTDRLGELVDKVTPGPVDVYPQPIGSADDAKAELAFQVDTTEDRQPFLFLLNAGGKCPATTGCGPTSQANAEFIALCFTHKDEILSALRKAEEADTAIERLTAREAELVEELAKLIHAGDSFCALFREMERREATRARLSLGDEK